MTMNSTITTPVPPLESLPFEGQTKHGVSEALSAFKRNDVPWKSGKMFGFTYDPGEEPLVVANEAYMQYLTENALDWSVFPSTHKLETDLIHICRELLRGDEQVVGSLTSGGTESILCAVKTARDYARAHKPHIARPEIVIPETAHAAFLKACHYFDIKPVLTGYDLNTYLADVDAIRNAITDNTILVVASAPGYSHGVVDPIWEIGQIALERDILFHIDACVGGLHLSFMRRMGYEVPDFDFSVPGVTSISVDLHKYAYAPKNISCILYRNIDLRFFQYFSCRRNTCFAIVNPTMLSTKSGGPYAGAWAILHFLGESGYRAIIEKVQRATDRFVEGIDSMQDLRMLGRPDMCMFAFTSDNLNIFEIADRVRDRRFYMQPQFSHGDSPANLHISVDWRCADFVDEALAVLREAVEEVKSDASAVGLAEVRATVRKIIAEQGPNAGAILREMAGIAGGGAPRSVAMMNSVLDALPVEMAEHILSDYSNRKLV